MSSATTPFEPDEEIARVEVVKRLFGTVEGPPRIGRFVPLRCVGEGGMGRVYAAYDEELDRKVALKILHRGVESDAKARVLREAKAMAKLRHPNVVQVFEIGDHAESLFIAMEFVAGATLAAWQADTRWTWTEIVEVYLQAGDGLSAAHAAGLVHRDFKPHNVMVDETGTGRRVLVLDFGLALSDDLPLCAERATDPSGDAGSGKLTTTGRVLGTLGYMAPEQLGGARVEAAADQFAFCVSLWEALYGERPGSEVPGRAIANGVTLSVPADSTVPAWLGAVLERGLAPVPGDRYPSMSDLLAEVRRKMAPRSSRMPRLFAAGAVVAGGLGFWAWADARAKRCGGAEEQLAGIWDDARRAEVEAALLSIELPYAAATWDRLSTDLDRYAADWVAMRTEACEATAVREEQSETVMDRRMACLHRARAQLDAVATVFADADRSAVNTAHGVLRSLPSLDRCADVDALLAEVEPASADEAEAVDEARALVAQARAEELAGRSAVAEARLLEAKKVLGDVRYEPVRIELAVVEGNVVSTLGRYEEAEAALQYAMTRAPHSRQWDELYEASRTWMVLVGYFMRRMDEALAVRGIVEGLAEGDAAREADVASGVSSVLWARGDYEEAESRARLALQRLDEAPVDNPLLASSYRGNLANLLRAQGKHADAEKEYRAAAAEAEAVLGPDHPVTLTAWHNIAGVLHELGQNTESAAEHRRALEGQLRVLGPDHPDVGLGHSNLALPLAALGKHAEAEAELEETIRIWTEALGPDHPEVAKAHSSLAVLLGMQGKLADAVREHRRALASEVRALGPKHVEVASTRYGLAKTLNGLGEHREAEAEYREAIAVMSELEPDHPRLGMFRAGLADALHPQGRFAEAEQEARAGLAIHLEGLGPDHPDVASTRGILATTLRLQGEYEEAEAEERRALAVREAQLGAHHSSVALSRYSLGMILVATRRYDDAEVQLRSAVEIWQQAFGAANNSTANAKAELARLLLHRGETEEALRLAEDAWRQHEEHGNPVTAATTALVLARALHAMDPGERVRTRALAQHALQTLQGSTHTAEIQHARALLREP